MNLSSKSFRCFGPNLLSIHAITRVNRFSVNQVNSYMCILSRMLITRIPAWRTTHFEAESRTMKVSKANLVQSLGEVLTSTTSLLNVGFMFSETNGFDMESMAALAKSLPPQCTLIGGCCTNGIISVDNMSGTFIETDAKELVNARYSLSLANMPNTVRRGFHIPLSALESDEGVQKALMYLPAYIPTPKVSAETDNGDTGTWKVIVLFVDYDAASTLCEELIKKLQAVYPSASIVGGLLGGTRKPLCIIENQKATLFDGGIVGMCIGGEVLFNSQVSRACKPVTKVAEILESTENVVKVVSVDGCRQNPLTFTQEGFGRAETPFIGFSSDLNLGFTLNSLKGITSEGHIKLHDGIVENQKYFQIFSLDPLSAKDDLRLRLDAAKVACASQSKQALGGLLFTCCGRGFGFYGEPHVESSIFSTSIPSAGLSGFFAGGEVNFISSTVNTSVLYIYFYFSSFNQWGCEFYTTSGTVSI